MKIKKRNSEIVKYESIKVYKAIEKAFIEVSKPDNNQVPELTAGIIDKLTKQVNNIARGFSRRKAGLTVDILQDIIEKQLMSYDYKEDGLHPELGLDVAKTYILYRETRDQARKQRVRDTKDALVSFKFLQAYAKYDSKKQRRETYEESCSRVEKMHLDKFRNTNVHPEYIKEIFDAVKAKQILPSMRSMQFGGEAILQNNLRLYNCSATPLDHYNKFSKILYVFLCGCGVGWDVSFDWVDKIPILKDNITTNKVKHILIEDTIEGWGDSIKELMISYFETGIHAEFSYHKIRKQGAPLKTSGGKAPGHLGLKRSIEAIRSLLDTRLGKKLRPIDCHDICCHLSDAVLSGGIRRSAGICLFSPDDLDMMCAKTGNWFNENPQRARSNNSCKLIYSKCTKEQLKQLFKRMVEFGEPGIYLAEHNKILTNPCGEIVMEPFIGEDSGFSFCNLTEVNVSDIQDSKELLRRVGLASALGTLQAAYTKFPYLDDCSTDIAERDALLGVSLTGIMDNYTLMLDPAILKKAALQAVSTNQTVARLIGINAARAVTTVKPSGTASIILGCVSNGIHPQHSKRYFRRVQINREDPIYKYFNKFNPHMCEKSTWSASGTDDIITFCVEAPVSSVIRDDLTAIASLKNVLNVKQNWINQGTQEVDGLAHNVSNTITVKPDEWKEVIEFVWKNRNNLAGVSFLGYYGDKGVQMPFESVTTAKDEQHWNYLASNYTEVDYTKLIEKEDNTQLKEIVACAGGACSLI